MKFNNLFLFSLMTLAPVSWAKAQLNFAFSINSGTAHSNVTGTVSGEIIGLQNNASSAPTDIVITSAPAGLNLPHLSYDLGANGWTLNGAGETITVSNGVITAADYQATLVGSGDFFDLNYSVMQNGVLLAQLNGLETGGETYTFNTNGFAGATYTPIVVPEPMSISLAVVALGLFGLLRYSGFRKSSQFTPRF